MASAFMSRIVKRSKIAEGTKSQRTSAASRPGVLEKWGMGPEELWRFNETPGALRAPSPKLGQDNTDILSELGNDRSAQGTLAEKGIF